LLFVSFHVRIVPQLALARFARGASTAQKRRFGRQQERRPRSRQLRTCRPRPSRAQLQADFSQNTCFRAAAQRPTLGRIAANLSQPTTLHRSPSPPARSQIVGQSIRRSGAKGSPPPSLYARRAPIFSARADDAHEIVSSQRRQPTQLLGSSE